MEKTLKMSEPFKKAVEKTEHLMLDNYYKYKDKVDKKFSQFVNDEIDFMELSDEHRYLLLVCALSLIAQKSMKK